MKTKKKYCNVSTTLLIQNYPAEKWVGVDFYIKCNQPKRSILQLIFMRWIEFNVNRNIDRGLYLTFNYCMRPRSLVNDHVNIIYGIIEMFPFKEHFSHANRPSVRDIQNY